MATLVNVMFWELFVGLRFFGLRRELLELQIDESTELLSVVNNVVQKACK